MWQTVIIDVKGTQIDVKWGRFIKSLYINLVPLMVSPPHSPRRVENWFSTAVRRRIFQSPECDKNENEAQVALWHSMDYSEKAAVATWSSRQTRKTAMITRAQRRSAVLSAGTVSVKPVFLPVTYSLVADYAFFFLKQHFYSSPLHNICATNPACDAWTSVSLVKRQWSCCSSLCNELPSNFLC